MREEREHNICAEPGCYNRRMDGWIYCVNHMYEFPEKASSEDIAWKKRQEKKSIDG